MQGVRCWAVIGNILPKWNLLIEQTPHWSLWIFEVLSVGEKKKNIKIRNISKSAVLSILSVFMDARIYSDRGDWSGNSNKTMLPSWQPSASLQWHFHVSWGRLRIFLFPEMLLELSHGCWAGSTCGTWLVGIHGVIPLGNTAVEGSCCPVPGIFLGYSGSFLALTSHPIY